MSMWEKLRVLVLVKTYPLPSLKYREVVCTAGITERGDWVRLYPLDFRYRSYEQWFSKYQWIEVTARKREKDPRPESYEPHPDEPITTLSTIGTEKRWEERKRLVLSQPLYQTCDLNAMSPRQRSLAVVKPAEITGLAIAPDKCHWKPKHLKLFQQLRLFGPQQKPLEKVPWKFQYTYRCEKPDCRGHRQRILDWELFQLFRKMRDQYGDERAIEKVKDKYLKEMITSKDPYFFLGTVGVKRVWIVAGVFYPPRERG